MTHEEDISRNILWDMIFSAVADGMAAGIAGHKNVGDLSPEQYADQVVNGWFGEEEDNEK